MITVLPVKDNDLLGTLRAFLRKLMETGVVEAIFVPLEVEAGLPIPALVTDPARLDLANPLLPAMPINNARAVSALTGKNTPARIGAVLRSCEIRALIELVKLQQASLENLITIGLDCLGTFDLTEYDRVRVNGQIDMTGYLAMTSQEAMLPADLNPAGSYQLRPACQMCIQPLPEKADIQFHLLGIDLSQGLPVTISEQIAAELGLTESMPASPPASNATVAKLMERRRQSREKELDAIRSRLTSNGGITGLFAACIRCHNCMTACPICYCRTCLFKTTAFDHPPEFYLQAAHNKGAIRMLGDTMLFHMTRLNHMSLSCVSCGMCSAACPADIPVGTIFSAIGEKVQKTFNYTPGRDVTEPLPLITYQAEEWVDIGEVG